VVNLEMDVLVKAARGAGRVLLPGLEPHRDDPEKKQTAWTMDRLLAKGFGRRRSPRNG
jgi:hypothetical protein